MKHILKEYILGDMVACYLIDEDKHIGLMLYPVKKPINKELRNDTKLDSLVQLKIAGDIYNGSYALGNTLRNGESVDRLSYVKQEREESSDTSIIITTVKDKRGYSIRHHLKWSQGDSFVRSYNTFFNEAEEAVTLEMFSSFSLSEISPYLDGDGHNQIIVHRLRSRWSEEGKLDSSSMEDLQLETSWGRSSVRCERFGQVGSMPVSHYFPFLTMEDKKNNIFWGASIAHGASWQMEVYRLDENIAISGGLADREFGHWMKKISPKESFTSPEAILTVCCTDSIDILAGRLTSAGIDAANQAPLVEQELPIIFNEYCTTWGCPSHENIKGILETIKGKGFTYFVIDCGWYKEEGVPWYSSMGDYEVSGELFPEGLAKTIAMIKEAGLKPGIWFEFENVGRDSKAYQESDHLLHLDGNVLTTTGRRFWDMRDPWVWNYLTEKVIGTLKRYGFEYMKIDYNDTIGIGCDGAESIGEGLRQNIEKTFEFIEEVKKEIPDIVLENCASGGHRLEPRFMGVTSMSSFSDAHECKEIPIIAANLHRAILPRQSQIWAVIRKSDSLKRIAYSIVNTFLGRMCISGDVTELSEEQWSLIQRGMKFYKKAAPIIKEGQSYRLGSSAKSIRHPEGWQGLVRMGNNGQAYVILHIFDGKLPDLIEIPVFEYTAENITEIYSDSNVIINIKDGILRYRPTENRKAIAILFG